MKRLVLATAAAVTVVGLAGGGGAPASPTTTSSDRAVALPRHALIGYLHASFANGSGYLRLADVPEEWDVVNLAFGEPTTPTSGEIRFSLCSPSECPGVESEAEFVAAIDAKQAQGKQVLLSIGGQNGQVQLTTAAARDAFVSPVSAIIDRYGLDGLDIDFEGHSLSLDPGDTDFRDPTTPVVVNLISALRALTERYGDDFVLTMAPETFFVQLGADFHIAMTDMLKAGFPVANTGHTFPPLREDQIAFGTPAANPAGNGYTPPEQIHQALDCLARGQSCGGYTLRGGPSPALRGLMTWSINWDHYHDWAFMNAHRPNLDGLP